MTTFKRSDFGDDFVWGVSSSAPQTEGSPFYGGRTASIWDEFHQKKWNKNLDSCNFYELYEQDIDLLASIGVTNFRISMSWSRILPKGSGMINSSGIDFYDRLTDYMLSKGITPWITLYHWDLPQALEEHGGWTNRETYEKFCEFAGSSVRALGHKIQNWMVLNEPMVFAGAGYFLGLHAPGKRGLKNFIPSLHHIALAQGEGARAVRAELSSANLGTTHSYTWFKPNDTQLAHAQAAHRANTLINKLFPSLAAGLGYPFETLPFLEKLTPFIKPGDDEKLIYPFDFWGLQVYTRFRVRHNVWIPYLKASIVPLKDKTSLTATGWEIYPDCITKACEDICSIPGSPKIYITENGVALNDTPVENRVHDEVRIKYLKDHIFKTLLLKKRGLPIHGYFIWSATDNFEWAHGYKPRFGLIYIDYKSHQRIIKDSALWFRDFLNE